MGFFAPSPMELMVILVIALLVLGPKRLPETARSLGRGVRELRDALQGMGEKGEDEDHDSAPHEDEPPTGRRDDPGGLPVDPAVVMGDEPYDDDLPEQASEGAQPDRSSDHARS